MKPVVQEVGCQEVAAALAAGEVVELVVEGHLEQNKLVEWNSVQLYFSFDSNYMLVEVSLVISGR